MRTYFLALATAGLLTATQSANAQPKPQLTPKEVQQQRAGEKVGGKTLYEWQTELKDRDPSVREKAIAALKVYGPMARDSVPELVKAMKDSDVSLKVNAV